MATTKIYLKPPAFRDSPLRSVYHLTTTDSELIEIRAGSLLDIPNVFSLVVAHVKMYASAVVGDRRVGFLRYVNHEGTDHDTTGFYSATFTASQNVDLDIDCESYISGATHMRPSFISIPPEGLLIQGDDFLRWYISGSKAGDRFSVLAEFKYMNDALGMTQVYDQQTVWRGRPPGRIK